VKRADLLGNKVMNQGPAPIPRGERILKKKESVHGVWTSV